MKQKKKTQQEELFLAALVDYNQKVLFPFMEETFFTKKDFAVHKDDYHTLKNEVFGLKEEFEDFRDKTLTGIDQILKKLDTLLVEKEVRDFQHKKEKQVLLIMIQALKEHNILNNKHLKQISALEVF